MSSFKNKKLTFLAIQFFIGFYVSAQYYIAPSFLSSAGKFKKMAGTGYGLEIGAAKNFYLGARSRTFLDFNLIKNKNNNYYTFESNPYEYNAYDSIKYQVNSYISFGAGWGVDFSPVSFGKFNLYYGLDFILGYLRSSAELSSKNVFNEPYTISEIEKSMMGSIRGRLGIEVSIKKASLGIEIGRSLNLSKPLRPYEAGKDIGFHGKTNLALFLRF